MNGMDRMTNEDSTVGVHPVHPVHPVRVEGIGFLSMTRRGSRGAEIWRDPPAVRVLKRVVIALLAVHVTLATISGYRAIVQVYRVEIAPPAAPLRAGSTVRASFTTSGRTVGWLELDLVQGGVARRLGVRRERGNGDGVYDPRPRHASLAVTLDAATLAGFRPGPAVLRATGRGSSQWLRVPPPVVREVAVVVARE
jgi:hypothetical protein